MLECPNPPSPAPIHPQFYIGVAGMHFRSMPPRRHSFNKPSKAWISVVSAHGGVAGNTSGTTLVPGRSVDQRTSYLILRPFQWPFFLFDTLWGQGEPCFWPFLHSKLDIFIFLDFSIKSDTKASSSNNQQRAILCNRLHHWQYA